jgi:hypothetical protein
MAFVARTRPDDPADRHPPIQPWHTCHSRFSHLPSGYHLSIWYFGILHLPYIFSHSACGAAIFGLPFSDDLWTYRLMTHINESEIRVDFDVTVISYLKHVWQWYWHCLSPLKRRHNAHSYYLTHKKTSEKCQVAKHLPSTVCRKSARHETRPSSYVKAASEQAQRPSVRFRTPNNHGSTQYKN